MAGRAPVPDSAVLEIGKACLAARREGKRWKLLERDHDRSRITLWRWTQIVRDAAQDETPLPPNETILA